MRVHRLVNILLTLEQQQKVTANQLASQLEISTRTVYRDLESLCQAGIPIVAEPGPNGGISLMEGYHTKLQHLEKDDIIYLYLNGLGIKAESRETLDQQSDSALKKLLNVLPEHELSQVKTLTGRFLVDNSPWWGKKKDMQDMDIYIQAVCKLEKIEIQYQKVNGDISKRTLRPYGIVVKDHVWYLIAYCEKSMSVRIFRCERITECLSLNEHFIYPESFNLADFFERQKNSFTQGCHLMEQYPVTLKCNKNSLYLLEDLDYFVIEDQKDFCTLCVNLYSKESAYNDHLKLLLQSTVIAPLDLRSDIISRLKEVLGSYENTN